MRTVGIVIGAIALALILAGSAFWGGLTMGKAQAQDTQSQFLASRGLSGTGTGTGGTGFGGGTGGTGFGGGTGATGANGNFARNGVVGTIQSISGNTVTISDTAGTVITVQITDTTPIIETVTRKASDLKVGQRIVAAGQRSGNNVAATQVQLSNLPAGTTGGYGGFGGGAYGTPGAGGRTRGGNGGVPSANGTPMPDQTPATTP